MKQIAKNGVSFLFLEVVAKKKEKKIHLHRVCAFPSYLFHFPEENAV